MVTPKYGSATLSLHTTLKKRVNDYFENRQIDPTGNYKLYWKAAILLTSYIAIYIHLVFFPHIVWLAVIECLFLGLLTASIGFNVMHDASHGSFSKHPWVNRIAALTLDFMGASSLMWSTKHNVVHHAYTNIDGVDDDINAQPWLRLCQTQKRFMVHRYQHLYFWALYSLLYCFWIFFTDYKKYFSRKVGVVPIQGIKLKDHIQFWAFKALYPFVFILLPMYFWGVIPWLVGYMIFAAVAGFTLSIVFQLAHTVEETSFPEAVQPANRVEDEWALAQLKSTANFATHNKFITWWLGGLNFQIEHHLFPKVSHVHYPAISRILRQTCLDLGVPYIEHRRMHLAVASHVSYLRKMGRKG
jgi:linoleoyl-CoA desaturase